MVSVVHYSKDSIFPFGIPVRSVRMNSKKSSRVGMICVSSLSLYSKLAAVVVRFLDDFRAPGIF